MGYFPDLSGSGNVRYVGYLSFWHVYPKGEVSPLFFERLVAVVPQKPRLSFAGYHSCDLGRCGIKRALSVRLDFREGPLFSFAHPARSYLESYRRTEIGGHRGRLLGVHGIEVPSGELIYCAPSLILHYILDHRYKPPDEFCGAVLNLPKLTSVPVEKRDLRKMLRKPLS